MSPFLTPPLLQLGDTIAVISPSGALQEQERFEKGLAVWRDRGYQIQLISHQEQQGYLAGTDEQRRHALQPCLEGIILALEDVNELPYRIDRMLTQWRLAGKLNQVGGIAFGRFSGCVAPTESLSWSVQEVLRDRAADLNCPIVSNLPFGHDGVNAVLPVGEIATLDGDEGVLTLGE